MADETVMSEPVPGTGATGGERKARPDPVIVREFPAIGKYRVRLVKSSAGPKASTVLDVREYAKGPSFEGFTRRGIRLATAAEAQALREALEVIERDALLK